MNRTTTEAIGLVLATLNLDDVYPAQRELLREALEAAVLKEREECAKVAETLTLDDLGSTDDWPDVIAAAIRSRT